MIQEFNLVKMHYGYQRVSTSPPKPDDLICMDFKKTSPIIMKHGFMHVLKPGWNIDGDGKVHGEIDRRVGFNLRTVKFQTMLGFDHGCAHSWKVYDSGWSRYEYCEKCQEKK